jgi:hypothetical protein
MSWVTTFQRSCIMTDKKLQTNLKKNEITPQAKNSLRHGLTAKKPFFIEGREEVEKSFYSETLNSLMSDLAPSDHVEVRLVETRALVLLKQFRLEVSEAEFWYKTSITKSHDLFLNTDEHTHKNLFRGGSEKLHTYKTAINNNFHKTLDALIKYREHRLKLVLFSNKGSNNG